MTEPTYAASADAATVLVVGAGPVGMTLSLLLAARGVRTALIEAGCGIGEGSRAINLSRRSLEIFRDAGALEPVLKKGIPWNSGRSYFRDREIFKFTMEHAPDDRDPPMINLQQSYLERFLLDAVSENGLVDLRLNTSLRQLTQFRDQVLATVGTDDGEEVFRPRWVVGCDGARSTVRQLLNVQLDGATYEGRFVIADIHLQTDRPPERFAWFDPPTFPGNTVLMHRQPDDIWRIDYQLASGEDEAQALDPAVLRPKIDAHLRWIGERAPWTIEWMSVYRAHARVAARLRSGRVFLAGDAGHLMPIFGVRGLNSGLVDAHNLAWKLGAVLSGEAPDALLDTYDSEQRHAAEENLRHARKSTVFMTPGSDGRRLVRDASLSLSVAVPEFGEFANPRQTEPIDYAGSDLNTPDRDTDGWHGGIGPGALLPSTPLVTSSGPEYLEDLLGDGLSLVTFGPPVAQHQALNGLPLSTVLLDADAAERSPGLRALAPAPGTTYLIRPDRYIAARWRRPSTEQIASAIRRALGTTWGES